jgi:hypothetical protein
VSTTQTVLAPNRLLAALPSKDREQLLAHCEQFELVFAKVLYRSGELLPHIYFPTGSIISLMTAIDECGNLEVGLDGNEGMLGITSDAGCRDCAFSRPGSGGRFGATHHGPRVSA